MAISKGSTTRERIVEAALSRASLEGLNALSIGELAQTVGMSKSGLFAHFGSKEALQLAVLDAMLRRFGDTVWRPVKAAPRGAARLKALFPRWLDWIDGEELPGGCPIQSAVVELDDRPGPLRDALHASQTRWVETIAREVANAQPEGDGDQFAFELNGLVMAYAASRKLLGDPRARERAERAFAGLLARFAIG
ncbi:MAG: TetR/AcrR family transcriptional regulator [Ferrovibrionaceae bacterium]|jgi:AcrR family transcriptional regulator